MADINSFVEKTLELLNVERQAEINESRAFYENADNKVLESKGVCLKKLVIFGRKTGLYGRILVTLGKPGGQTSKSLPLQAHCITAGMINSQLYICTLYSTVLRWIGLILFLHFSFHLQYNSFCVITKL